jgi:hypothetical protein
MADERDSVVEAFREAAVIADRSAVKIELHLDGVWVVGKGKHPQRGYFQVTVISDWGLLDCARRPLDHLRAAVDECAGKVKLTEEAA